RPTSSQPSPGSRRAGPARKCSAHSPRSIVWYLGTVLDVDEHGELAIAAPDRWWLGAVGMREDGSRRDFYEVIASASQCAKTPEKRDGVSTDRLLPQSWDHHVRPHPCGQR